MAQKKFLDLTGLTYFWEKVKGYVDPKLANKVDKEDGKQLSTEDYTSEEKLKLAGLENYELPKASSETLGGIKVGAGLVIDGEGNLSATGGGEADSVNWENVVGRPTKVSEFENDSKFQTDVEVNAAVIPKADKTYVDEQLGNKAEKSHQHTKADISDFPTNVSEFTNDSGYQTAANVEETLSGKGYATTAQLADYVNNETLEGKGYLTEVPEEYVTDTELTEKGYQTAENVQALIADKADKSYVDGELAKKATTEALTSGLEGKSDKGHTHTKSEITDMPTKLSEFQNDSKFQTDTQVSSAIAAAIGEVSQFDVQVLESIENLPEEGKKGTFYLVPNSGKEKNIYDEYIWTGAEYECLGTRDIDLSGYVQESDLVAITTGEIDGIVAA